jgi:serine/threonine protein kinase, bacterial
VGDGGPATEARLDAPSYIALDAGCNLCIAENRGERIRKVSPAGIITTVTGTGKVGRTGDGGLATAASSALAAKRYRGPGG